MKLILLNQTYQYPNELNSIETCLSHINQLLSESEFVLSHLEVDKVKVYEDHNDYITNRISDIKLIEVIVVTFRQLLDETIVELGKYLSRSIPEMKSLSEEFYNGPSKETWVKLNQLLEGLQWILQAIQPIYMIRDNKQIYVNSMEYSIIAAELTEQFKDLESALSHSDIVLTGDLLKYEIVQLLVKLADTIQNTIDNEVVRNDLN
ncbi:MAG: hypothetical protein WD469_00690 [Paenibacillaceae bacterium]